MKTNARIILDSFKHDVSLRFKQPSEEMSPGSSNAENSSSKHQITPLKTKNKTFKSENKDDVHVSSPVTPKSKLSRSQTPSPCGSSLASAYYVGICSQDVPEVIWDYTSPKQNKAARKDERKIVIDDLLQHMRDEYQPPKDNTRTSANLKLLEKWMQIRSTSPLQRVQKKVFQKRATRKQPSRHLIEEMQAVLNSLSNRDRNPSSSENSCDGANKVIDSSETCLKAQKHETNDCAVEKSNATVEANDEDWGNDEDDLIIAKATQEFESFLINSQINAEESEDKFEPVIPDTMEIKGKCNDICPEYGSFSSSNALNQKTANENVFKKPMLKKDSKKRLNYNDVADKTSHISYNDSHDGVWDSEYDNIWGDEASEIETLSQIPDDVLLGKIDSSKNLAKSVCATKNIAVLNNAEIFQEKKHFDCTYMDMSLRRDCTPVSAFSTDFTKITSKVDSAELLQTSNRDQFLDHLSNKYEFTTMQNNKKARSGVKCTAEEIARKRAEALKRLKLKHKKNF